MLLFAGILAIASCKKKENDDEVPVIAINLPIDGSSVNTGSSLQFDAVFTDNEDLGQYKIEIHSDFDGHTHEKTNEAIPWETVIIEDITGTSQNVSKSISVPDTAAAGAYHLVVSCIDKSGNEAESVALEFMVVNLTDTVAPVLSISSPTDMQQLNVGDTLVITGSVTDNMEVEAVEIIIERASDETTVADQDIDIHAPQGNINASVPTASLSAGTYHVHITAIDHVNNQSEVEIEIGLN